MSTNSSYGQGAIFTTIDQLMVSINPSQAIWSGATPFPTIKEIPIEFSLTGSALSNLWAKTDFSSIMLLITAFLLFRACVIVVHRLYFNTLAGIPGPKLAAATRLYEFYFQGLQHTKFPQHIKELHQKYGPIVRISPFEVSLNDSDFNADFFLQDRKLDKDPWYYYFGYDNALFVLTDKAKHKHRQANLAAHFGGAYWKAARPMITTEIGALMSKFAANGDGEELNLSTTYRKAGNEIMRNFLLGENYAGEGADSRDFGRDAQPVFHPLFRGASVIRHFNVLYWLQRLTPSWVFAYTMPMAKFQREIQRMIRGLVARHDAATASGKPSAADSALLYKIIDHDHSYRDDDSAPAVEEFMELLWGGREVLGHALCNVSYHLARNPGCMAKLRDELRGAAPQKLDLDLASAPYADLRHLPYLWAVCKEGIRLQRGGNFRIPRVCAQDVLYRSHLLPAGTAISMSPNFFHQDPTIFPEPERFLPERWLEAAAASGGDHTGTAKTSAADGSVATTTPLDRLERYWNPFGNGSRSCGGRPMAYEVIFRAVANVFASYKLVLADDCTPDACRTDGMLEVFPPGSSKGLRVKLEAWEN